MVKPLITLYLKRRLVSLCTATLCSFLLAGVSGLTYFLIGPAIDILTNPDKYQVFDLKKILGENKLGLWLDSWVGLPTLPAEDFWRYLPWALVSMAAVRALLALLQWYLWERASEQIASEIRVDVIDAYLKVDPERRAEHKQAIDQEISAAISSDVRSVKDYLVHYFGGFPREAIQVLGYLVMLFVLDWQLSLIFILGLGPAGALLSKLGKKLKRRSKKALGEGSVLLEWLQQRFTGLETVKQFGTEALEEERMRQQSEQLQHQILKAARVKARTSPMMETVAVAAIAVVLLFAMRAIAANDMSASTLMSFVALLSVLSQSAAKLGRYYNSNKEGEAALSRLETILNLMRTHARPELPWPHDAKQKARLAIEGLGFTYKKASKPAIVNFSAQYEPGRIYAIAGASGSGKSTLLKLLLGLAQASEGRLSYSLSSRKQLGYLPQQIQLLPASLRSNLTYPFADIEDQGRLEEALRLVSMKDFVAGLPKGLDTVVGEGGDTMLSGGQAQRIHIARLFYQRFPLLVIDEGTSALDPETEALVLKSLRALADEGTTIVMVAHRVAVLQLADEVAVLRAGSTVFKGSPKELLQLPDWRQYFEAE